MTALLWSERLLGAAVLLQTIELLQLRVSWSDEGIWRWSALRADFAMLPRWLRVILDVLLSARGFHALLWLRLLCCAASWLSPSAILPGGIFLGTWLICLRWRGTFNGGSDSMTSLVAFSIWVARLAGDTVWMVRASLAYIAVQVTASYLVAGWVKIMNPRWRSGEALPAILRTPGYDSPPAWLLRLLDRPGMARLTACSLILFECAFPLAWLGERICLAFIAVAIVFHLLNFVVFGLNRFVFAWLAAYPALYFWSQRTGG